jgi:uncharacterized protein YkwD
MMHTNRLFRRLPSVRRAVAWAPMLLFALSFSCSDDDDQLARLVAQCKQCSSEQHCELYRRINVRRRSNDLPLYVYHDALARAAQSHADDMAQNDLLGHESSDGRSWEDRIYDAGYDGGAIAENIARAPDIAAVMQLWMPADGTGGNLMSRNATQAGIGVQADRWVITLGRPY